LDFTLELLNQFQKATLFKYQSGDLLYFEVVRAKVEIAKTQNEVLEAKKELISAKMEFNLLLGKKGSEEFELADSLAYVPFDKSKEKAVEEFVHQNRTLKITQLSRERESKSLSLAKTSFIPDLHFSGGYLSESGGKFIPSFEVGFSLPLWWWNPKGQIQENKANLRIAYIREQAMERTVRSEIESAYDIVKASQEQVVLFEKTLLKEIGEELKAGINSYQYNQIDALGLLDIYRTNKTTQIEYYKTLFNYLSALADMEVSGEETE
jgi:outer membrane protein TolC